MIRIDRKIEFPLPDERTKRRIFGIHTGAAARRSLLHTNPMLLQAG
jgi:ATP-dependent 26S proteasome regulatory subunit